MIHKRYQHIERYNTNNDEVNGIEIGICYVFPKIDGTNSQVYLRDSELKAGSKNRELTLENDNQGFYKNIKDDENILAYLQKHPTHRLYGEWLVPHTLKTYRSDAWRKFYIFDVCLDKEDESLEYLPYEIYQPLLVEFDLNYLAPLKIIKNGDYESFIKCLEVNNFLIKDGCGNGEGIVIKNYDYYNRYGRQTWAKIVSSEFKENHYKAMGAPVYENKMIEQKIVDDYVTTAFVEKEYAKIVNDNNGWNSKYIPQLLGIVYHELITEEMWNIIKKNKNPKIDFKTLQILTTNKVKSVKSDIFN